VANLYPYATLGEIHRADPRYSQAWLVFAESLTELDADRMSTVDDLAPPSTCASTASE
jgi:hypothetical protein